MDTSTLVAVITAVAALIGAVSPIILYLIKLNRNKSKPSNSIIVPEGYKLHRPKPQIPWKTVIAYAFLGGVLGYIGVQIFNFNSYNETLVNTPLANGVSLLDISDDFNNPTYEGNYNSEVWLRNVSGQCQIAQQNGVMVFANTTSDNYLKCAMTARTIESVPFKKLSIIQADMKIPSQVENPGKVEQVIRIATIDYPNGEWWVACGLAFEANETKFFLNVFLDDYSRTSESSEFFQTLKASSDTWYAIKLEIGLDKTIKCYADNVLIGALRSRYEIELENSHYEIGFTGYRTPNAFGDTLIDNAKIYFNK